jgi:hypothetical protein
MVQTSFVRDRSIGRTVPDTKPKPSRRDPLSRDFGLASDCDLESSRKGGIAVTELNTESRDKLRKDQFAYVDSKGGEHLPIHDDEHIRNAMARFNQTDFESTAAKERARKKILAAAKRHDIEVSDDSNVARAAKH